ncbi:MAG: rhodanese-like domain-containing protein [bacterium]|nr:rhodanese-like domain-containing protein [bacterium]
MDVRTVEEYEAGHVPGAFNIPYAFRGAVGMELNPNFVRATSRSTSNATRSSFCPAPRESAPRGPATYSIRGLSAS